MATVLAFDVNETLLDLSALEPVFDRVLGDGGLRAQWFPLMLQLGFVGGLTGDYIDFTTAARAALRMTAARAGRDNTDDQVDEVVAAMRRLPAHPDVRPALAAVRDAGFRLTALTNSVLAVAEDQLANAGLRDLFEAVYSADEVRALKPAPQPYRLVAERSGVPTGDVRLVAAHAWDVTGALAAGCAAAFVGRGRAVLSPLGPQPDVVGPDLSAVAVEIIKRDTAR